MMEKRIVFVATFYRYSAAFLLQAVPHNNGEILRYARGNFERDPYFFRLGKMELRIDGDSRNEISLFCPGEGQRPGDIPAWGKAKRRPRCALGNDEGLKAQNKYPLEASW